LNQLIKKRKAEPNNYIVQKIVFEHNINQLEKLKIEQSSLVVNMMKTKLNILKESISLILKGNQLFQMALYNFINHGFEPGREKKGRDISKQIKNELILFLRQEVQFAYSNDKNDDQNGNIHFLEAITILYAENISCAYNIFNTSAKLGNPIAKYVVASNIKCRSVNILKNSKDLEDCFKDKYTLLLEASNLNIREATHEVARAFEYGTLQKTKNIKSAIKFYMKAADQNYESSLRKLEYHHRKYPKYITKEYLQIVKKKQESLKSEIENLDIFDLFIRYQSDCNLLVLLMTARKKNLDSPFHEYIFPLDLLKVIARMADLCRFASF
jgi:hypothetical protein